MRYSVWWLPAANDARRLAAVIDDLANRFGKQPFEPHMTLASGQSDDEAAISRAVMLLPDLIRPARLSINGFGFGREMTTYFHLRLDAPAARAAFAVAARALPAFESPAAGPHLSLLYDDGCAGVRRPTLAAELAARVGTAIGFNHFACVTPVNGNGPGPWRVAVRTAAP